MNKITCICLGVRDMARSVAFYRDKLGFRTDCVEDSPRVCFFDTPGTKFELYPLDLLAQDIRPDDPPAAAGGFGGITLAYNVASREEVVEVVEAGPIRRRHRRQGASGGLLGRLPRLLRRPRRLLLGGRLGP